MTKIAIVTDSTAGITAAQLKTYSNLFVVPVTVSFGNDSYREGIDISNAAFFEKLANTKTFPTTAPPTTISMLELYTKLANQGFTDVISIHMTKGISGFLGNLEAALQDFTTINVIPYDSYVSVLPMSYEARVAANMAAVGLSVNRIIHTLDHVRESLGELFVVDDLKNLVQGGRLGSAAGFAGTLLRIKPILTLDSDTHKIIPLDKVRSLKKAIRSLEQRFDEAQSSLSYPVHIMLVGTNNAAAIAEWSQQLQQKYPEMTIETGQMGPVLGAHLGQNAWGLLWAQDVL